MELVLLPVAGLLLMLLAGVGSLIRLLLVDLPAEYDKTLGPYRPWEKRIHDITEAQRT